jgi:hypothetical protein
MTTKRSKRKSKQSQKKKNAEKGLQVPESSAMDNDAVGYVGLPDRDLKKNLGCG